MRLSTEGTILVDEHGRQRVLHGITLEAAGSPRASDADLEHLRTMGLDAVRLDVVREEQRSSLGELLDRLHAADLAVVLHAPRDVLAQDLAEHPAVVGCAAPGDPADDDPDGRMVTLHAGAQACSAHADALGSDSAEELFEHAAEAGARLGVPVVVSGWGAFGTRTGISPAADSQLDLFDRSAWSWFYSSWEEGFSTTEAAERLRRPRPVAIAGRDLRSGTSAGGSWKSAWTGRTGDEPSELWIPEELDVELRVDGERSELERDGARVLIPAADGDHRLRVS